MKEPSLNTDLSVAPEIAQLAMAFIPARQDPAAPRTDGRIAGDLADLAAVPQRWWDLVRFDQDRPLRIPVPGAPGTGMRSGRSWSNRTRSHQRCGTAARSARSPAIRPSVRGAAGSCRAGMNAMASCAISGATERSVFNEGSFMCRLWLELQLLTPD